MSCRNNGLRVGRAATMARELLSLSDSDTPLPECLVRQLDQRIADFGVRSASASPPTGRLDQSPDLARWRRRARCGKRDGVGLSSIHVAVGQLCFSIQPSSVLSKSLFNGVA